MARRSTKVAAGRADSVADTEMGPAYWISMGATAISVRAAAGILDLHSRAAGALVSTMHPFTLGLSVVLWSFGTWWIPLLVLFRIWRYLVRRCSREHEPRLWNVVSPRGMYTVATYGLGQVRGLDFMSAVSSLGGLGGSRRLGGGARSHARRRSPGPAPPVA